MNRVAIEVGSEMADAATAAGDGARRSERDPRRRGTLGSVRKEDAPGRDVDAVAASEDDGASVDDVSLPRRPHPVLRALWLGVSAGVFAIVMLLAAVLVVIPWVTHSTPMTILTSSMEPNLPPGTLIVVKPTPVDEIRVGDVMTYQIAPGKPAVVSHRVLSVSVATDGKRSFITKGDNNPSPDPTVIADQVRGTVWYSVPWVGYISTAVNGPNRGWIMPVLAVALIGYAAFMLSGGILDARKRRRARR